MGMKMAGKRILPSPGKWGKNGLENGKNGLKMAQKWNFGPCFPLSQVRPKSMFRPFSSPCRAGGPK